MQKIQTNLKHALELVNVGFEIVPDPKVMCHVRLLSVADETKVKKSRKLPQFDVVRMDTLLTLSHDGTEPHSGKIKKAWDKTKQKMWGSNIGKAYTRREITECLAKYGSNDNSAVTRMVNHFHCLKRTVIEDRKLKIASG
jgi:hypothetical protein